MEQERETVVVTGSSGFIGSEVCRRLAESRNVVGFDRPGAPHPPPEADRVDVDLTDEQSVRRAFEEVRRKYGTRIASVIHLAAYYDFSGRPSPKYEEVTVQGTGRLLRHLKPFQVEQLQFSSTMLVHAPCERGQRINEAWPLGPKWDYPKSKVKTENLIRRERGKMPALFLRIAGVYDDDCHSIPIARQIQRIYERSFTSRLFPGNLSHGQSFVHVNDTATLIVDAVNQRRRLAQESALLVGEPVAVPYGTLQNEIGRLVHGVPWPTHRVPKLLAKAGAWLQDHVPFAREPFIKPWMIDIADDHYDLDTTRALKTLGWKPAHALQAALPVMIERLLNDPVTWYRENRIDPPSWLKAGRRPPRPGGRAGRPKDAPELVGAGNGRHA